MSISLSFKCLGAWFLMLIISMINGALRDFGYGKYMTELHAHQLSTVISLIVLGALMWLFTSHYATASVREALILGGFWSGLTLAFEFLFFHYVGKHSWTELLANYDVLHGRIWVLVVLWLFIAPYVFFIFKKVH